MTVDSAEAFFLDMTVYNVVREIDELSKAIRDQRYAEFLAREHTVAELERAEALLSCLIATLRKKLILEAVPMTTDAVIIDLTKRLGK